MTSFTVIIDKKVAEYLERLTYEVESRKSIIDFMFQSHKNDKDASLFESIPWKTYMKEYQDFFVELDMAKAEASKIVMAKINEMFGRSIDCTWKMIDFKEGLIEITLSEDIPDNKEMGSC